MVKNILQKIVETKKVEIAEAKKRVPEAKLREQVEGRDNQRPFTERLRRTHQSGTGILAEIKRASPSRGVIRQDLDAAWQAEKYEQGGATAISVLTDRQYFQGSFEDLKNTRANSSLPVLRKDFLIDAYQVYESAAMGADAILLIVRILSESQLTELTALSRKLKLDALVEIHDTVDLEKATAAGAELIGINNRDLRTFKTDLTVATGLVSRFKENQIPIAASGISSREDIVNTKKAGINNFLIGESLVRAEDTVAFLKNLVNAPD